MKKHPACQASTPLSEGNEENTHKFPFPEGVANPISLGWLPSHSQWLHKVVVFDDRLALN